MDSKLKGFFDTAQQKAGEITAAQTAAAAAEARRQTEQAANSQILKSQIDEELGPILDVLTSLPDKDGKHFSASVQERSFNSSSDADYSVTVTYKRPASEYDRDYDPPGYASPLPSTNIGITRKSDGSLNFSIRQYSIMEYQHGESSHKYTRATTFEAARQELALGLGTFAADRMADIGAALGAAPSSEGTAEPGPQSTPASDAAKIAVFRKPLQLKGGSNAPVPEKSVVPVESGASAPRQKRFWNRFGF